MSRVVVNEIEAKVGNDITFNDTVKIDTAQIDTVRGKTTAGSVTVQGEGTATTNLQQGLIKHWINMNGTGTIAIKDSFNASAIADMGGGDYVITVSNNLANDDYTLAFNQLADVTPSESCFVGLRAGGTVTTKSTSQYRGLSVDQGGGVEDNVDFGCMIAGDLA